MQTIRDMLIAQGFKIGKDGELIVESGTTLKMSVPSSMVPKCPRCGEPMALNLRSSDTFVEDDGWFAANKRYYEFLNKHEGQKIVLLELGVGGNTPVIIKYPFWRMAYNNVNATYVCINYGQSFAPKEIESRSICIDADILQVLECLE
jgi:NAD-dependent SIR2 family protein deacetylase